MTKDKAWLIDNLTKQLNLSNDLNGSEGYQRGYYRGIEIAGILVKELDEPNILDNTIQPDHYLNDDGQDLFEKWYQKYPLYIFLEIMTCIEERYEFRAERKNGDEDLRKAEEVRKRKAEYVNRHEAETTTQLFGNNEQVLPDDQNYMPMPD